MRGEQKHDLHKNQPLPCERNPGGLSNLWYGSDSAVVEIRDAVEDAKNGKDLLNRIQKMKLLRKFTLDRENDKRIRFKGTDCWGNVSYLEIIR